MSVLGRKLVRDLWSLRGQVLAIALIIACGVASFVCVITAYQGLIASRDTYYAAYRMPDLFAPVKKAPVALVERLQDVPGVRRVRPRIVFGVTLDMPSLPEAVSARMVSLPDRRQPVVGDIRLERGRWFEGDGEGQVIVARSFAEAHGLDIGDRVPAVMNNRKRPLRIVGVGKSPEHVYMIRGAADLLPDPERFTVLWVSTSFAESVFDFGDSANEFVALLDRDAVEREVIDGFDRLLDPYGALGAYGREDQISDQFVSNEIDELRGTATFVPTLFLAVAAFVLHVLMRRLVRTQRTQIAVFRAFGYGARRLTTHYLLLASAIGALGCTAGLAVGIWWSRALLELYLQFFDFPELSFPRDPTLWFVAVGGTFAFALAGAATSVRAVARLEPAEGLRAETPPSFRHTLLERVPFVWSRLSFSTRMVLRNLSRTRARAASTWIGVVFATAMLTMAFHLQTATDALLERQFHWIERHDVRVAFHDERGAAAVYELARLPGVVHAEPETAVPVRLRSAWRTEKTAITGVPAAPRLSALLDDELRHVEPPPDGLALSTKLAELLGVGVGDAVEVEVLFGAKPVFTTHVAAVVRQYLGAGAYARSERLSHWVGEDLLVTGALLDVAGDGDDVGRALKDVPAVAGVGFKQRSIRAFEETIEESQAIMNGIQLLFAGSLAFGVLYNAARIALAERQRVFASMSVIGFSRGEVATALSMESFLICGAGLLPGVGLGLLFAWALTRTMDSELFRIPYVIDARTPLFAVGAIIVFAWCADRLARRKLRGLDAAEVLKARE